MTKNERLKHLVDLAQELRGMGVGIYEKPFYGLVEHPSDLKFLMDHGHSIRDSIARNRRLTEGGYDLELLRQISYGGKRKEGGNLFGVVVADVIDICRQQGLDFQLLTEEEKRAVQQSIEIEEMQNSHPVEVVNKAIIGNGEPPIELQYSDIYLLLNLGDSTLYQKVEKTSVDCDYEISVHAFRNNKGHHLFGGFDVQDFQEAVLDIPGFGDNSREDYVERVKRILLE